MSLKVLAALALALAASVALAGGKGSGGAVYVKPHVTKSGTYVQGHYRSAPNSSKADNYSTSGNVNPYTGEAGKVDPLSLPAARPHSAYPVVPAAPSIATYSLGGAVARDPATGRIDRSEAAKRDFRNTNPCPSTGIKGGACPGYEIDHATPLKCGGADAPTNMQWLSSEVHALKTASEASSCR